MTEANFKTLSGASVIIQISDFESGMALHDAVLGELSSLKLDLNFAFLKDVKSVADIKELEVSEVLTALTKELLPAAARLAASKTVKAALFSCLARATYNGEKITKATFEDVKARADFHEVMLQCLKVNLSPFFSSLVSQLTTLQGVMTGVTRQ